MPVSLRCLRSLAQISGKYRPHAFGRLACPEFPKEKADSVRAINSLIRALSLMRWKSAVKLPNFRTGSASRFAGTATQCDALPMSIPDLANSVAEARRLHTYSSPSFACQAAWSYRRYSQSEIINRCA